MAKVEQAKDRREGPLSRERIVEAAIVLLDERGEDGLTFRALATRLATGPGAIYWHITNKSELLVAASNAVVANALAAAAAHAKPHEAIRSVAGSVFDAIDAHPWVGTQISRTPWETAALQILERVGRELQALAVPRSAQFTSASALVSYILGASTQNAINGRLLEPNADRTRFLTTLSASLDHVAYPFIRGVSAELREHDDREEFLAGVDLILAGIEASL